MQLTPEQVKGRIKNVAKENKADARTLMRMVRTHVVLMYCFWATSAQLLRGMTAL